MAANLKRKKTDFYIALGAAVIAFFACVLAAVGGGYVTLAWFNGTRNATVNTASLIVGQRGTVSSVNIYAYHSLTSTELTALGGTAPSGVYTFEKTPISGTANLGKYSLLKPIENALLFEVTLSDYGKSTGNIDLSAHSDATAYHGAVNSDGTLALPLKSASQGTNSLSSIVCFYAFSGASGAGVSVGDTYQSVTLASTVNPSASKLTFVSSKAIVNNVAISTLPSSVNKVYFVLDYDISLIEDVYSANIGNDAVSNLDNVGSDGQSYLIYLADFYFWISVAQ
jgi:hypothetical protein